MIILKEGDEVPHQDGADICPQCGFKGLDWAQIENFDDVAIQPAECPNCGLMFDDVYHISTRTITGGPDRMANGQIARKKA